MGTPGTLTRSTSNGLTTTSHTHAVDYNAGVTLRNQTYTWVLSDEYGIIYSDNSSAYTYTIPTHASVAFPVGTMLQVHNAGTGNITISASSIGTGNLYWLRGNDTTTTGSRTVAGGGFCTLIKINTSNRWHIFGAGIS
jgi:hypothetical protein